MSLDLTILNADGTPGQSLCLSVETHWKLVMRAQPIERFPLISRLKDYYEDADFKHNEIQDLRIELENIDIKELENCIRRFILLCDSAMTNAKGIAAISD